MRRLSFGSWLACTICLLLALNGWAPGAALSVSIALAHAVLLAAVLGRRASVAIQLRVMFSLVVLAGAASSHLLWWAPVTGATIRLTFDYCLGGRLLMLMPWNRSVPIDLPFLRALFAPDEGWARRFDGLGPRGVRPARTDAAPRSG